MEIIENIVDGSAEISNDQIEDKLQVMMKIDRQTAESYVEMYNKKNLQNV